MAIFPTFLLGNIVQENVFYDIREGKNAFRAYENKKFKKSKKWDFSKGCPKGTHGLGPKWAILPSFFV